MVVSCFVWKNSSGKKSTQPNSVNPKAAELAVVLFVASSIVIALITTTGCGSGNVAAAEIDPCHVDVGRFTAGPMLSYEFKIPNESNDPYRILTIRKTCGCHSTEFDPMKSIKPGDSASVKVNLPTAGSEGKTRYQFVMETDSENEKLKRIPMTLTVDLVSKIKAYPSIVTMGKLQAGAKNQSTITITATDIDPASAYTGFELEQEFEAVTVVQKENAPRGTLAFDVAVSNSAPLGDITGFVVLKFDDEQVPEIRVPVIGRIEGALMTTPSVLVRNSGASSRTVVRITSRNSEPFEVGDIRSPDGITLEPESTDDEYEHRFRVAISDDIEPGSYSIAFSTNQPGQKTITLPVVIH